MNQSKYSLRERSSLRRLYSVTVPDINRSVNISTSTRVEEDISDEEYEPSEDVTSHTVDDDIEDIEEEFERTHTTGDDKTADTSSTSDPRVRHTSTTTTTTPTGLTTCILPSRGQLLYDQRQHIDRTIRDSFGDDDEEQSRRLRDMNKQLLEALKTEKRRSMALSTIIENAGLTEDGKVVGVSRILDYTTDGTTRPAYSQPVSVIRCDVTTTTTTPRNPTGTNPLSQQEPGTQQTTQTDMETDAQQKRQDLVPLRGDITAHNVTPIVVPDGGSVPVQVQQQQQEPRESTYIVVNAYDEDTDCSFVPDIPTTTVAEKTHEEQVNVSQCSIETTKTADPNQYDADQFFVEDVSITKYFRMKLKSVLRSIETLDKLYNDARVIDDHVDTNMRGVQPTRPDIRKFPAYEQTVQLIRALHGLRSIDVGQIQTERIIVHKFTKFVNNTICWLLWKRTVIDTEYRKYAKSHDILEVLSTITKTLELADDMCNLISDVVEMVFPSSVYLKVRVNQLKRTLRMCKKNLL